MSRFEPVPLFMTAAAALAGSGGRLTEREQARADRFRDDADRDAYRAAHLLVRRAAALAAGVDPDELVLEQRCPDCGKTDHGRPSIAGRPDIHVSLSHTRGWVAALAADAVCGIDVEAPRPVSEALRRRMLTADDLARVAAGPDPDLAFTRLWAVKEALVKAGALGLHDVAPLHDRRDVTLWEEPGIVGAWVVME